MGRIPISIVVPALNEEANISRCLERLADFEDVIVVDSGSSDRTTEIAREMGAEVVNFRWNGKFPKKRNWVLGNHQFRTEWILFLDADEQLTDAFKREVGAALPSTPHAGFWLNYDNFFMGRHLRFGVPQRKLALFKKELGRYERIEEDNWSPLDMEIHEHPQVAGSVGEIKNRIIHRQYKSIGHFIARHNDYSDWEARRSLTLFENNSNLNSLTKRQNLKYSMIRRGWFPLAYFVLTYLLRLGVLDGRAGFHYAVMKAIYFYQIGLKIRELRDAASERGN